MSFINAINPRNWLKNPFKNVNFPKLTLKKPKFLQRKKKPQNPFSTKERSGITSMIMFGVMIIVAFAIAYLAFTHLFLAILAGIMIAAPYTGKPRGSTHEPYTDAYKSQHYNNSIAVLFIGHLIFSLANSQVAIDLYANWHNGILAVPNVTAIVIFLIGLWWAHHISKHKHADAVKKRIHDLIDDLTELAKFHDTDVADLNTLSLQELEDLLVMAKARKIERGLCEAEIKDLQQQLADLKAVHAAKRKRTAGRLVGLRKKLKNQSKA